MEGLDYIGNCTNRSSVILFDNNIIRSVRLFAPYGIGYIRMVIEDEEPLGKYTVQANVIDRNLNKSLELENHFLAVKASSQHNKAPQPTQ